MASILFVDGGNWNGVTTVQVNVLNYFAEQGHELEIILFDNGIEPSPVKMDRWPRGERIRYRVIQQHSQADKIFNRIPYGKHFVRLFKCWRILRSHTKVYAFDYEAGIVCGLYQFFSRSFKYFVHSIELYEGSRKSWLAKLSFEKADHIIIQDRVRKEKLIELYSLKHSENILESVNSSRNSDRIDITPLHFPSFIKNKFKVLFIGSLIDQHCYPDVLEITHSIPDHMCLIIHGWGGEKFEAKLKQLVANKPQNVWVSDFKLDDISKFRLYSSVDIGLVSFNSNYFNGKYAGLSAGKLYDFMRVGKPVLVSNIPGLSELVSNIEVGKVMKSIADCYPIAKEIEDGYAHFSARSFAAFPEYEFDANFHKVYLQYMGVK